MKKLSLRYVFLFACIATVSVTYGSGTGRWIGDTFNYYDDSGDTYTTRSIGGFDYTYGSNGYEGKGHSIGNVYSYQDNNSTID